LEKYNLFIRSRRLSRSGGDHRGEITKGKASGEITGGNYPRGNHQGEITGGVHLEPL